MTTPTLKSGTLAYYDTFSGLIPCRVVSVSGRSGRGGSAQDVTFILTANRGNYRRGERLVSSALHVFPRDAVRRVDHGHRVSDFVVECS